MLWTLIDFDRKTEKIMSQHQAAIVQDLPLHAVYLSFALQESAAKARYARLCSNYKHSLTVNIW
jgi:deferrochelatase/peroxidase EfeB